MDTDTDTDRAGPDARRFSGPAPGHRPWQGQFFGMRSARAVAVLGAVMVAVWVGLALLLGVPVGVGWAAGFGSVAVLCAVFYGYGTWWVTHHRAFARAESDRWREYNDRRLLGGRWYFIVVLPVLTGVVTGFRTYDDGDGVWEWFAGFGAVAVPTSLLAFVLYRRARNRADRARREPAPKRA